MLFTNKTLQQQLFYHSYLLACVLQFTVIFTLPLQLIKGHVSNGREIVAKWEARAQVQVGPDKLRSKTICTSRLSSHFFPLGSLADLFLSCSSFSHFTFHFSCFIFLSCFLFSHPLPNMDALSLLSLPLNLWTALSSVLFFFFFSPQAPGEERNFLLLGWYVLAVLGTIWSYSYLLPHSHLKFLLTASASFLTLGATFSFQGWFLSAYTNCNMIWGCSYWFL